MLNQKAWLNKCFKFLQKTADEERTYFKLSGSFFHNRDSAMEQNRKSPLGQILSTIGPERGTSFMSVDMTGQKEANLFLCLSHEWIHTPL